MTFLHMVILAVVQGITEFLPISSSAHLILVPHLLNAADQGLAVDIGAHAGTLLAVVLIFWRETWMMIRGSLDIVTLRKSHNAMQTWRLVIATIPGALAGLAILNYQETLTRHIPLIIASNLIWATALYWVDRRSPQDKTMTTDLTWRRALFVGLAQVIALIPGTSRSGITMTASRHLGFSRVEAARLSFTMSIPITLGAVLAVGYKFAQSQPTAEQWQSMALVAGMAFVTAIVTILGLMTWLKRFNYTPFVIYRLLLAAVLIVWFYT